MLTSQEIIDGNRLILQSDFHEYELNMERQLSDISDKFLLKSIKYHTDIAWLWPVIHNIRAYAYGHQERFGILWLAIAMELYKVEIDISELYKTVVFFIQQTIKGTAPVSSN